ncbi:MAG: glycosyltransferase family 4 protein [SAR324 cluster bacterium]|nr:glycosyltransferase family 4 protein [SAR324 cluster bacterium]
MRLAALVTHPVQYFAPVFRELSKKEDLELKVFFGCDHGAKFGEDPGFKTEFAWDCQPTEGFEHEFVTQGSLEQLRGASGVLSAFKAAIAIQHYHPNYVLIFSYSPAFITVSTIILHLLHYSLLLRAETTDEAVDRSVLKDKIREVLLKQYYRQFQHFFPIGQNSIRHYQRIGISHDHLTAIKYAIDVDFFKQQVDKWSPQRNVLRDKMTIPADAHVFLYCGKMYCPKNPLLIPSAFSLLSLEEKKNVWLLAVGDGDSRNEFEACMKKQLGERAIFTGFQNQSELGQYYAMADTLLFPSQSGETWGLVVNEALQFGLRVIVSDKVGCAHDLVTDSNIGFIFPSNDASAFANTIVQAIVPQNQPKPLGVDALPHPKHLADAVLSYLKSQ